MNKILGVAGIVGTAYYALMLLIFIGRDVEGSAFSRLLRMVVVAWYGVLGSVSLLHRFVISYEQPSESEIADESASASRKRTQACSSRALRRRSA